jgi:hypothetical protein
MKCAVCEQKKGKRTCPAKSASICASCCGEKRVLEIACPEDCTYLITGREHEAADYAQLLRRLDPNAQKRNEQVFLNHLNVLGRLEYSLARERFLSRDLTDNDVAQAVDLLLEKCRTEEKGVFYEKTSDDLRVESLRRVLRGVIDSFRNPQREDGPAAISPQDSPLPLSSAIDCLECIRSLIGAFQAEGRSASAYVDFLARFYPREEARNSIILA